MGRNILYKACMVIAVLGSCLVARKAQAQVPDSWTQRADIGGGGRNGAFSFGNNTTGYIGGGFTNANMWQYNTTTDTWSQKADYPGAETVWSNSFSIGNKGYVGLGGFNTVANDFWEYDMAANTWASKATFPGAARGRAAGFVVNGKAYVCTGSSTYTSTSGNYADLWEYDPATNAWTSKASFPGVGRQFAVGFSIGANGYVGTGTTYSSSNTYYQDFYKYNPASNTWTAITSYPNGIYGSSSFSLGNKGYVGIGITQGPSGFLKTTALYAYDPLTNSWASKAPFPGAARNSAVGFNIGLRAYLGTGYGTNQSYESDVYEYMSDALITGPVASTVCAGESLTISYNTATPYFNSGNVFTAQLSNAAGSFASPLTIGTVTSITAGTITVTIPSGTPPGTGYRIRVTGSSPAGTGTDNGTDIFISGGRVYVDGTVAASGAGNSWATAFKTLNEALTFANDNSCANEVWVKAGTYKPTTGTSRDSTFRILRNGLKVYGGFAGTETLLSQRNATANLTILSGDIGAANDSTDNTYNIITVSAQLANAADTVHTVIDGFTIEKGNGNSGYPAGTTINTRNQAGGLLIKATAANTTNVDVSNCVIRKNFGVYGGGLCTYANGAAGKTGVSINRTVFENNNAAFGGAVCFVAFPAGDGKTSIQNSLFVNNTAGIGSAILFDGDGSGSTLATTIGNCTFYAPASTVFYNAQQNGGTSNVAVNNSIIWKNGAPFATLFTGSNISFTNNALNIAAPGATNVNTDPYFVNASNAIGADNLWGTADDGLRLTPCSPLINAGSNALIPAAITTDLAGAARIRQTTVDMGAYESAVLPLSVIKSHTNVLCKGAATGTATVAVTGGSGTYTYSWNTTPVKTTATATGLAAGSYTVTITDQSGCTVTRTDTITEPATVLATSVSAQTNLLCKGAATGSATVSATGGTGAYTYSWSPSGGTAATATGLAANTYTVTVKDANNCSAAQPVTITEPATSVTASVTSQTNVLCFGNNTGTATATASGGTGTLTYSWNTTPVQTTATATGLPAGTYTVTVKDANNCSATANATISQPVTGLSATTTKTNAACFGAATGTATAIPTGGTAPYTYAWNTTPAQTTITATGLPAGTYTVTVKDGANCTTTANATIGQPAAAIATSVSAQTNVLCKGSATGSATVSATGGTGPYTYSWSPSGGTAATATGLAANTYTVTVKDAHNCSATQPVVITEPATGIAAAISAQTNINCFAGATGAATVTATGGTGTYTYSWNTTPVQTTATATGLPAGTYTVTVKDASNCTATANATITQPAAALSAGVASNSPQCAGATLTITTTPAGGTAPYTYAWTGPGSYTATTASVTLSPVTTAQAGTYNLTLTDSKGCTITGQATVVVSTVPAQPAAISGSAAVCGGSGNTYRITPVATATSYTWTLPSAPAGWTATSAAGLDSVRATAPNAPGNGILTVTANNGCGSSPSQTLAIAVTTIPATPTAVTGDTAVCGGISRLYSTNPAAQATAYAWTVPAGWSAPSPSATNSFINSTPPTATGTGSGTITVKASNFCGTSAAASLAVVVTNIPAQPAAISGAAAVCGGTAQLYKTTKVTGATAYTWSAAGNGWTAAAGTAADTFLNATAGTAGTTISVTAANYCGTSPARTLAVAVTNIPGTAGAILGPDSVCTGQGAVTFTTGQINEAASYTWTIPPGWTGTSSTTSLSITPGSTAATGAVTVRVAGTNSCGTGAVAQKTFIVNNPVTPSVTLTAPSGVVCAGAAVTYTATAVNGGASPLYQWKINNVNAGAPASSNTFTPAVLGNGDVVSVAVKTSLPCATTAGGWASATAPAQVVTPVVMPGININATLPPDLCRDVAVTFFSNVTAGGSSPSYRWWKNGAPIAGATGANYTDNALNNRDTVRVVLTSNAQCRLADTVSSNRMGVSVSPYVTPVVTISANPGTSVAAGQTVIFTAFVSNGGPNPEVRWKRNGQTVAGTSGLSWTTSTLRDGDVIGAELVSGARCATPFLVTSTGVLRMSVSTGVGSVTAGKTGEVSLYPNPTTGRFTVRVKGGSNAAGNVSSKRMVIEVVNSVGQVVYRSAVRPGGPDWSVDVSLEEQTANGVYMLTVGEEDAPKEQQAVIRFELRR